MTFSEYSHISLDLPFCTIDGKGSELLTEEESIKRRLRNVIIYYSPGTAEHITRLVSMYIHFQP